YYRDKRYAVAELSPEEVSGQLSDGTDMESERIRQEEILRLRREIAYLSKLQREIVIAYYFENKRQNQIAEEMGIPTGTVKWHLFETKKELKRSMENINTHSQFIFHPIRFSEIGTNGRVGENGPNENYFKTALPQNIVYLTLRSATGSRKSIRRRFPDTSGVIPTRSLPKRPPT
ncbi:MAG: sigma-70 family RNA polymerase sigma factor, partial [Clostridia bacterium]|nr:sigma-70 family RNA polymerase sigma factor [Clostridia bacterium]